MADKKPSKRSGAPGGERPMRRRDTRSAPRDSKTPREDFGEKRPRGDRSAAPARADAKSPKPWGAKPGGAKPARVQKPRPEPVERTSAFEGERIAKAMARAGVCSRRDAEEWIAQGRVAVNGVTLRGPAVNVTEADQITIDGAPMQARERTRLFLFHKPAGLVTTASDPEGRATVFAFLEERHPDLPRLISVGRLDINTEGLLLLTNDGGLARTLELPATGWTRRYRVRVHGETDQAQLDALREGVTVEDVTYAPIEARLERVQGSNAWIAMSLTEGKNREVKRVMEHLGLEVTRLIRVSYGPFQLGDLAEGAVEEVKLKILREQLGKSLAEFAGVDFASPLREAEPAELEEKRVHAEKRPRKHVSVLRQQRDAQSEKGPRVRIERSATADRKGRAVTVERVTPTARKTRKDEDAPESRNARRFDAMRTGRPPRRAETETERPRGARGRDAGFARDDRGAEGRRPSRFGAEGAERPARRPRDASSERGQEARAPRGRDQVERRPRDAGNGERRPRSAGAERPERWSERPARAPRGDGQERAARPRGASGGDRAERQERWSERPPRAPRGDQPQRSAGPRRASAGQRFEEGDRPARAPRERTPRDDAGRAPRGGPPRKGGGPGKGGPRGGGFKGGGSRGGAPGSGPKGRGGPSKGPRRPRGE